MALGFRTLRGGLVGDLGSSPAVLSAASRPGDWAGAVAEPGATAGIFVAVGAIAALASTAGAESATRATGAVRLTGATDFASTCATAGLLVELSGFAGGVVATVLAA